MHPLWESRQAPVGLLYRWNRESGQGTPTQPAGAGYVDTARQMSQKPDPLQARGRRIVM